MKLYSCLISLGMNNGGPNPHHEVPRYDVTRAEVIILRSLHGSDAVIDLVHTGDTVEGMSDMDVYHSLTETYPAKLIERLFGVQLTDLSTGLDDLEADLPGERITPLPKPAKVNDADFSEAVSFTKNKREPVQIG